MIGREAGDSLASVMRSLSLSFFSRQVYQLHQDEREKERREAADLQRWTKMGSFRRGRGLKQICHSHESLAVEAEEAVRLGGATSVHSVAAAVAAGGPSRGEGDASRIAGWAVNFQRFLQDPAGRHIFTEFLKKEFSEENIIFWLACENFKEIEDNEDRQRRAAEIYEQHLAIRAPEPVNVDSQARQSAMELLDHPTPDMFDMAQMQIFQLMKQDSYARFLKSDCYKTYLMREMEGKPLDLPQPLLASSKPAKAKEDKKKKGKEEKGKRRSILPWRQKDKKTKGDSGSEGPGKGKAGKEVNNNKKQPSSAGVDLAALRRETIPVRELEPTEEIEEDTRFCRVILPDGSTTVVCARAGMSAYAVLGKLCEKRGFNVAAVEVFFTGAEKPLDLNEDAGKLGSREVRIERRVLFRLDLPNKKTIGVKAKPNRVARDLFKPILAKYGHRMDDCCIQVSGHSEPLDLDSLVSVLDNETVLVLPASSSGEEERAVEEVDLENLPASNAETGRRGPARRSRRGSLEELTNGLFEALMLGKSHLAHSFDELGTVDLDASKVRKSRGEPPSLGLFGGRAKRGASKENRKQKARNQVTFALQKNEVKFQPKEHDEEFFELLSRVQGQRLEDQRGPWEGPALELPDFLRLQSRRRSLERSVSASDLFDEVCYMRGNSFHSLQPGHLYPGLLGPSRSASSGQQPGADLSDGPQHAPGEHMDVLGEEGRSSDPGCYDGGASADSPSSRLVDSSAAPELQAWSDASPPLPMQPVVVDMADEGSRGQSGDGQGRAEHSEEGAWLDSRTQVPLASPEKFSPLRPVAEPMREAGPSHTYSTLQSVSTSGEALPDFEAPYQYSHYPENSEAVARDHTYPQRSGFRRVPQSGGSQGDGVGMGRLAMGHTGDPSIVQAELSVDRLAAGIPARSAPWQQAGRAPGLVTFSHQGPRPSSTRPPSTRPAQDTTPEQRLCPTGDESNQVERQGGGRRQLNPDFHDRSKESVQNRGKPDSDGVLASVEDRFAEGGKHSKDSVTSSEQKRNVETSHIHQRNGASSSETYTQQKQSARESSSTEKKSDVQTAREPSWRRALPFSRPSRGSQPQAAQDQEPKSPAHDVGSSQAEVLRRRLPHTPSPVDQTKGAVPPPSETQKRNSPSAPPIQHGKTSPRAGQSLQQSSVSADGKNTPVTRREQQEYSTSASSPHGYSSSTPQHSGSYNQNPPPQTFRSPTQTSSSVRTFKMHSSGGFGGGTSNSSGASQQPGVREGAAPTTQVNAFVSHSGPFHLQSSNVDSRSHQGYSKQIQNQKWTHTQDVFHPSKGAFGGGRGYDRGADGFAAAHQNSPAFGGRHFLHNSPHESHPSFPSPNHSSYLCSSFQNGSRDGGESSGVVEETVTFV